MGDGSWEVLGGVGGSEPSLYGNGLVKSPIAQGVAFRLVQGCVDFL